MSTKLLLRDAEIIAAVLLLMALYVMWRNRLFTTFKSLGLYLVSLLALELIQVPVLFFRKDLGIDPRVAFNVLWYGTQTLAIVQSVLMVAVIYGVFWHAMRPFEGLQRMGTLVFKWVAAVSVLLGTVIALSPHVFSTGTPSAFAATAVIGRAQEGVNVLTICLLLFVCIAIKPLGLTYRSRVFGVALGLGIISTTELVQAAYFWSGTHSVYSPIYLFGTIGYVVAISTWGMYMAMPEPARKLITLPTTSPFHNWNRISQALGDASGDVALNFSASMISPIETKVLTAMSRATRKRETLAQSKVDSELDSLAAS